MTQTEVARAIGISQGHYHRIESRGETTPETAALLVDLFGPDSGLTELHVLFPDRYPEDALPRVFSSESAA